MKLSKPQTETLLHYFKKEQRIIFGTRGDPCMCALSRRGLAEWHNKVGQKYGKSYWWITDAGLVEARQLSLNVSADNAEC